MRILFIPLLIVAAATTFAADKLDDGVWITGEVFTKDNVLLFRADTAITGNSTGNVVLIGPTKDNVQLMGSILMRAAERHVKLRFYGVLSRATSPPSGHHGKLSTMQFAVRKMHAPTDPDELPAGQAIHPDPHMPVPGYSVTVPAQAPDSNDARLIAERVNAFFKKHQTPENRAVESALRTEYLTQRYQRERADDDKHPEDMDGDPYTLSDAGWDVGAIQVKAVDVQGTRAEASVTRGGADSGMKISLVKHEGKWLIDRMYFPRK